MSYGEKREGMMNWVLEEDEAMKHLKVSCGPIGRYPADDIARLRCRNQRLWYTTANCHTADCHQTFDTADTYSAGVSERILGKFLKTYEIPRENVVILTKTYFEFGPAEAHGPAGFANNARLSRKVSFHRWLHT
jgi:hypothetical protein